MFSYKFERRSIFIEEFTVDAATEAEALELVRNGGPQVQISDCVWRDWYDDDYSLIDVEGLEYVEDQLASTE